MEAGLPLRAMAVNISAMEFRHENFLDGVFAILEETGMDPACLELELTESVLMKRRSIRETVLETAESQRGADCRR